MSFRVHQVLSGAGPYDAVTTQALAFRDQAVHGPVRLLLDGQVALEEQARAASRAEKGGIEHPKSALAPKILTPTIRMHEKDGNESRFFCLQLEFRGQAATG